MKPLRKIHVLELPGEKEESPAQTVNEQKRGEIPSNKLNQPSIIPGPEDSLIKAKKNTASSLRASMTGIVQSVKVVQRMKEIDDNFKNNSAFFHNLNANGAVQKLSQQPPGSYLLRVSESAKKAGGTGYVVSYVDQANKIHHASIDAQSARNLPNFIRELGLDKPLARPLTQAELEVIRKYLNENHNPYKDPDFVNFAKKNKIEPADAWKLERNKYSQDYAFKIIGPSDFYQPDLKNPQRDFSSLKEFNFHGEQLEIFSGSIKSNSAENNTDYELPIVKKNEGFLKTLLNAAIKPEQDKKEKLAAEAINSLFSVPKGVDVRIAEYLGTTINSLLRTNQATAKVARSAQATAKVPGVTNFSAKPVLENSSPKRRM